MAICIACKNETTNAKFCSNKCQKTYEAIALIEKFENGGYVGKTFQIRGWLRDYILEKYNHSCSECGINEWNGKPLTIEIDHVDGDACNNTSDNMRPLCPNCHSQTDTMRNKGGRNSSRTRRRSSVGRAVHL